MLTAKLPLLGKRHRMQVLVALTYHIMNFAHGLGIGWVSPTVEIIQSPETPLSFPVTVEDVSWIGSLFGFGFLSGNILFGLTANRLSRKLNMYLLALPNMLFWILIYFVQNVKYLYAGRFFGGVTAGGLFVIAPMFFIEILDKDVRGTLMSMGMTFLSCGIVTGFILPTKVDYYLTPCIGLALPIIYVVVFCFFPETPQSLLRSGRFTEAEAAFNFYKGIDNAKNLQLSRRVEESKTATEVQSEFEELKTIILRENANVTVKLQDFCRFEKSALKAFADTFVLCILYQLSGTFAFLNYMTSIFAVSGSTMDPYFCTIIVGVTHICGTIVAAVFVDRFGRRALLFSGTTAMIIGMFGFGAFVQFTDAAIKAQYDWAPLAFMIAVVFTSAYGLYGNFFTIVVEILPVKIRSPALSISMCFMSLLVFVILKLYPYFLVELGIPATMFTSGTISVVTTTYLFKFLPETKGKSMEKD
ncbi:facilitated trehalose transporter Tret1-like [Bactrocera tryoni]|uniref:facilitated trehalose transporter Tret1-like n=1 Tax=Bactrocera tryoni TaxID=59916 RepID=UPI001A95FE9D|nr:facilitated trehalose transporter Tret1-like [Bactrocera tryoni]